MVTLDLYVNSKSMSIIKWLWVALIFLSANVWAQLAEPVQFTEKIHDFGEVVETNGLAVFDFTFTNLASRPIKIVAVQPSCGCTTPDWTKHQVLPGKTGFVRASYNPTDRPGYFDKSLTVTTDMDGSPIVLRIKGNVVAAKTDNVKQPYDLVVEVGHLLFRNSSFNLGKVYVNKDPVPVEFPTYNRGKDTVKIFGVTAPAHISVVVPKKIAPAAQALIRITYDASIKKEYGFLSDKIVLNTSDESQPEKSFSVHVTAEEYFPKLTSAEQARAPVFKLDSYSVDLGTIKTQLTKRTVTYQNAGKKPLIIRHMQSSCVCLTIQPTARVLQPGQVGQLQFTFNAEGRGGPQNKFITVYSTDPINPVQRLTIQAIVD